MDVCSCDVKEPIPHPASARAGAVCGAEMIVADRVLHGTLVIREEGLYLFIERCEERPSLLLSLVNMAVDKAAGLAGGLLMKAAEAGTKEEAGLPPETKPREDYHAYYDRLLHEAPGILHSRWCLPITRGKVRRALFRGEGLLELSLAGEDAEVWAKSHGPLAFGSTTARS